MAIKDQVGIKATVGLEQSFNLYLKKAGTFDPFVWAGERARLDAQTENDGGISVTQRFASGGGTVVDNVLQDVAGTVDFSIIMKRILNDRKKTDLKKCWWNVDSRLHCGRGVDRASASGWSEIDRYVWTKHTGREKSQTSWDAEAEAMVTLPFQGLTSFDLYRITGQIVDALPSGAAILAAVTDVDVCHHGSCGECNNEEEPVAVAVTDLVAAGSPALLTNLRNGDPDYWTSISLTEWSAAGADAVLCMGNTLIIVSNGEAEILRSNDRGVNRSQVAIAEFAANPPNCIDGLNDSFILMGGDNGYVYRSFDAGATWEVADGGNATTENLTKIVIAPDNPRTAWAIGENNALIKTENAGETWATYTGPSVGNVLLALGVLSEFKILIMDDAGSIWETEDDGATWTEHDALPSLPAGAITGADMEITPWGTASAIATDGTTSILWRNVDGGADARWYIPTGGDGFSVTQDMVALAHLETNRILVGGGVPALSNTLAIFA